MYGEESFFSLYGWAAMGGGLPLAYGVQLGRPDRRVVAVVGDGAFLTHLGELQAIATRKLPLICLVVNDEAYGQVGNFMNEFMGSRLGCDLGRVDAAAIGASMGWSAFSSTTAQEFDAAVKGALDTDGPVVIDARVDGNQLEDVMHPETRAFVEKIYARK